jgi:hypothetical protein
MVPTDGTRAHGHAWPATIDVAAALPAFIEHGWEGTFMGAQNSKRTTGYPPVTESETQQALEGATAGRPSANSNLIIDAMAGVVERHRRRIDAAALDAEVKHYALDLLDAVFLDLLQTMLDKGSALEVLRSSRRARGG